MSHLCSRTRATFGAAATDHVSAAWLIGFQLAQGDSAEWHSFPAIYDSHEPRRETVSHYPPAKNRRGPMPNADAHG